MNVSKVVMGAGIAVGLLSSTVAMAADTRSSAALPGVRAGVTAPVKGVRTATNLKKKSLQSDDSKTGTYIVGGLAAAAVIAGVVVIATDSSDNGDDSPG